MLPGYLESSNILSASQYGFRPKKSSYQALTNEIEKIYTSLDCDK